MRINKAAIERVCDKVIEYSFYMLLFFLPSSKAIIELTSTLIILAWLIKKLTCIKTQELSLRDSPSLFAATTTSLILLIPLAAVISSAFYNQHLNLRLQTPVPLLWAAVDSLILITPLALFFISAFSAKRFNFNLKMSIISFLIVTIVTSMFTSRYPEISLGAFFFKTLQYLLTFFIVSEAINTRRRLINALIVIFVSSFITGLDGIYQQVFGHDLFRNFPLFADVKVSATFQFSNNFGTYIATILPVPIGLLFYKVTGKKMRFILFGLCVLLGVCLLLTQARGAWLGFIFGFLLIAFFHSRKSFLTAVCILISFGFLAISFSPPIVKEQIRSFANLKMDQSTGDRMIIWKTAWRMFLEKPVLGNGLGTFMKVFEKTKPASYHEIVYAHNCFLQTAAETGIVGLFIFLWLVFSVLRAAIRKFFILEDLFLKAVTIGLFGGIAAYLINSFFDTCLYSLPLAVLFWAAIGLAAAEINPVKEQSSLTG
ncbi:MAG: O-antigen ligase family protein [Candidatus Omnitrophota bacterium]